MRQPQYSQNLRVAEDETDSASMLRADRAAAHVNDAHSKRTPEQAARRTAARHLRKERAGLAVRVRVTLSWHGDGDDDHCTNRVALRSATCMGRNSTAARVYLGGQIT